VLGGDAVGKRGRFIERLEQDRRAIDVPALARDVSARQRRKLFHHRLLDGGSKCCIVGHQDRLRGRIVLRLRQQIGGDPMRVVILVGDDQHFRRTGDRIDADGAEHLPLGCRHIGIAGTDNFDHRLDRLGAMGQRGDGLGAADAVDFFNARKFGGGEHERVQLSARRRHHHDDARYACDLGRHGVHQHRAWIGGRPARHVEANGFDRGPTVAEFHARGVTIAIV